MQSLNFCIIPGAAVLFSGVSSSWTLLVVCPSFLHACAAGTELHTVKGMVGALMHELEVILHEYLSFNWDRLDDILAANKHLLEPDGPALPSPRPKHSTEAAQSIEGQVCTRVGSGDCTAPPGLCCAVQAMLVR